MFDSQATNPPSFEFSSWRHRSDNIQQQTNVFGCQLGWWDNPCSPIPLYWTTIVLVDAPFTSPKTFHTLPRIEPPGSFSIVDRVLDHVEPQVKSPSVPLEKHSESHAQQHTESISDKDDDDDDMWMSVSYDNVPDDKMPLTWESHVPGTRFLTEMPPEYYESIYQRWDSLVAIVLHYANSHLLSQLCATSIFIDSRRAIGRGIKMRIRVWCGNWCIWE